MIFALLNANIMQMNKCIITILASEIHAYIIRLYKVTESISPPSVS